MQQSVSDSESAPNTLQSATKRFLVTYRCIAKRYKALCNARLMQLVPGDTSKKGWLNDKKCTPKLLYPKLSGSEISISVQIEEFTPQSEVLDNEHCSLSNTSLCGVNSWS